MSKIKDLLNDNKSILVFDVDGVLALLEFGERRHYALDDNSWEKANQEGINFYNEDKVSKKMQKFLNKKDKARIYVITTIGGNNEGLFKQEFVNKYYSVLKDHVYFVDKNRDKTNILIKIRNMHKDVDDENIIMIDDTVEILNDVMEKTNFSTAHISSFLDI